MEKLINVFIDGDKSHYDIVVISPQGDRVVIACYDSRPELLKIFKTDMDWVAPEKGKEDVPQNTDG